MQADMVSIIKENAIKRKNLVTDQQVASLLLNSWVGLKSCSYFMPFWSILITYGWFSMTDIWDS